MIKRFQMWFRRGLSRLTLWAIAPDLAQAPALLKLRLTVARDAVTAAKAEGNVIREQMAALQAVDLGFRDGGKIVLVARIGEKHIVRVYDIRPLADLMEYRKLSDEITARFGVTGVIIDAPPDVRRVWNKL